MPLLDRIHRWYARHKLRQATIAAAIAVKFIIKWREFFSIIWRSVDKI